MEKVNERTQIRNTELAVLFLHLHLSSSRRFLQLENLAELWPWDPPLLTIQRGLTEHVYLLTFLFKKQVIIFAEACMEKIRF